MTIPILSIIGKSGSGKTTLLEKLIPELKRRGCRIATIKHHSHPGFEIDQRGKDTWRHAQAGSDHVIIAAPDKIASIRRLERELTLDEIAASLQNSAPNTIDIILTEGYKRAGKPAIEVVRRAMLNQEPSADILVSGPPQLIAIAADIPLPVSVPQFDLEDIRQIADFIERQFLK